MKPLKGIVMLMCCLSLTALTASELKNNGKITKVTVYRGQALITRQIDTELSQGTAELVAGHLPEHLIPESLFAQTQNHIKILSVRYRQRAVTEDTREEVQALDQQIQRLEQSLHENAALAEHLSAQWKMYENLKNFTVEAKKLDLSQGILAYEPIKDLTDMIESKGLVYLEKRLDLEQSRSKLTDELALAQRQRSAITSQTSRTEREAVIYVQCSQPGPASLELNYLVREAQWQQQYNLRALPDESRVSLEYHAVVNQNSGEDWDGVSINLSTAEPTMVSSAPVLSPVRVGLTRNTVMQQQAEPRVDVPMEKIKQNFFSRQQNIKQGLAANTLLNALAEDNQMLFLNNGTAQIREMQQAIDEIMRVEGVSVTYELPGKLTLPSRDDQQLVSIATMTAPAEFTLIASPLLTDYVYLQANVHNTSQTVFLPGPASVFKNNQFVGRSEVPLVTIGDTFTAGFGTDSQVQVAHALDNKQTRIQGGNRIDTFDYQISLSNYKASPVNLRLLDRLPYSEDASIKIELVKTEPALSQDNDYLKTDRKKGILQWDLTLAPHTTDDKALLITYTYTMEYDKNMQIHATSVGAQR
ncbi:MAG: mucoidy inhibitor MuiA family protein [Phycisphaerae bacterium]|nr:mucoidy inhibitor MuiA family protein [Phycisphaerae bacterium]